MKILFASSEAHPLIKTGGLADVAGALPRVLHAMGHDIRLVLPAYPAARQRAGDLQVVAEVILPPGHQAVRILEGRLPGTAVPVYLVDSPRHFERSGNPYTAPDGNDWPDNAQRFAVFCQAIRALAMDNAGLGWAPEVVHCNDWQTGLAPALLSLEPVRPVTLFTIHNLAYQGLFPWETFQALGLPYAWWAMAGLEFYGQMSFIKGGLAFADWLTTVSPSYAREIRGPVYGCGLDGLLTHRADRLVGILNGTDYDEWDPQRDPHLARPYSARDLGGKTADKAALQARFGLPPEPRTPVFGHVGRLVEQKGIDLLLGLLPELLRRNLQLVVLGSGQASLEAALRDAHTRFPERIGVEIGYDESLAHLIEGGADAFLMPSRFEPCGLNQLYSLRYGTPPVVRRTGGLADTVVDADPVALAEGRATGFAFDAAEPRALLGAIDRALILYAQPEAWRHMQTTAMAQDFSWERSAERYLDLYRQALEAGPGVPPE